MSMINSMKRVELSDELAGGAWGNVPLLLREREIAPKQI